MWLPDLEGDGSTPIPDDERGPFSTTWLAVATRFPPLSGSQNGLGTRNTFLDH
jgi:hypothetical protein